MNRTDRLPIAIHGHRDHRTPHAEHHLTGHPCLSPRSTKGDGSDQKSDHKAEGGERSAGHGHRYADAATRNKGLFIAPNTKKPRLLDGARYVFDRVENQAAASALAISFLIFRALVDSSVSFALAKNASKPPR